MNKCSMILTSGIFISAELLKKAGLDQDRVTIEIHDHLITLSPASPVEQERPLAKNSPLWDMVAMDVDRETGSV